MIEQLSSWTDAAYRVVWGFPLLILISGLGIYLTVFLRAIQIGYLGYALKIVIGKEKVESGKGDISHFQSLMTALAATIGIGNIAGVSTALVIGGPGALFWMWITAFFGMATKYAESYLAVKYRIEDENGEMAGGPMFFIERGLKWHWLAFSFALFGVLASFGGGNMLQANSVAEALLTSFSIDPFWTGLIMAAVTGLTLFGGIRTIGKVASFLVPMMAFFYIAGAMTVILYHLDRVPFALMKIFTSAFSRSAAVGGFTGATLLTALQTGVSRGLMTSEAGLGTASIASAAAKTDLPGRQALVSMTGSFLATIILCTITALVLNVTQVFGTTYENGSLITGVALTAKAFTSVFSWGGYIVTFGVIFFGFTTLLGWAYYGEKCIEYLMGVKAIPPFRILFTLIIIPGAILDLEIVWKISDVFNGLMAYPNLIGIAALSGIVISETKSFLKQVEKEHQRAVVQEALR